jgi:hypothetical protein
VSKFVSQNDNLAGCMGKGGITGKRFGQLGAAAEKEEFHMAYRASFLRARKKVKIKDGYPNKS